MEKHFIYFDKKSLLNHDVEYINVKTFLSAPQNNIVLDWECDKEDLVGEISPPKIGELLTFIVPYEVITGKKISLKPFFSNLLMVGKVRIVYFNKKDQKEKVSRPCFGIPTDRGSFVFESMLDFISDQNSTGILNTLPKSTKILYIQSIPKPHEIMDHFQFIFFGLKKINSHIDYQRIKIKALFSSLSLEVNNQQLFKNKNFSLKIGYNNNLFVFSLRWKTNSVNPFKFMEEVKEWGTLAPQVSAIWFNFFRETKEVEVIALNSFAFDSSRSLPPVGNAFPLGCFVVENEKIKNSPFLTIEQDTSVKAFKTLIYKGDEKDMTQPDMTVSRELRSNESNIIWVSKKSVMGHGINFREFIQQMDLKSEAIVNSWIIEQDDWLAGTLKKDKNKVHTFIIPYHWILSLPNDLPEEFLKRVEKGEIRIIHFNKKGDVPLSLFPTMSIPSDRGSLVMEAILSLIGQTHHSGIQSLFPRGTSILSVKTSFLRGHTSRGFEKLFEKIQEMNEGRFDLNKIKVNFISKNIVRLIFENEKAKNSEDIIMKMGFWNKLLAFSVNFKTSENPLDWINSREAWRPIFSSTSSLWFNYFPDESRTEVLYLLSFSVDYENSFVEINKANPLGIEVYSGLRKVGQDKESLDLENENLKIYHVLEKSSNDFIKEHKKEKGYTFESPAAKLEKEAYSFEVAELKSKGLQNNIEHNPHLLCVSLYLYHKLVGDLVFNEMMNQKNVEKLRIYWKLENLMEYYDVKTWKEVYLKLNSYHKGKEDFYREKVKSHYDLISLITDRLGNSIQHFYKRSGFYGQEPSELYDFLPHVPDLFSFSVRIGFRECIKYFVDWSLIDKKFIMRSLDVAIRRNKFDIVKVITKNIDYIDWMENRDLIYWVIDNNFLDILEILIQKGLNIDRHKSDKDAPLCYASNIKRINIVRFLMENGSDINRYKGFSLELAIKNNDLNLVKYILDSKMMKQSNIERCLRIAERKDNDMKIVLMLTNALTEDSLKENKS